jgi:hypothetical protein
MGLPFVADGGHGLGQISLRGSVVALGNSHEEGVEYVKLSDTGGVVLAQKRRAARRRHQYHVGEFSRRL